MNKINALTPQQEKQLRKHRQKWLKIGLACGPADMEAVGRVIPALYEVIGEPAPYVWQVPSPMTAQLLMNLLGGNLEENLGGVLRGNLKGSLWRNLGENLQDNLGKNLGHHLWKNLRANSEANLWIGLRANLEANLRRDVGDLVSNLWHNLECNLESNLRRILRENLWRNLESGLRDNMGVVLQDNLRHNLEGNLLANLRHDLWWNLWENLQRSLRRNLRTNLWENLRVNLVENLRGNLKYYHTNLWGSLESYWIAYYKFPHEHLRPMHTSEQCETLRLWEMMARSAFWWYPFKNVCFVCDRPAEIHKDAQGRLHNPHGPAVTFTDGWGIYAWHGVNIFQEHAWIITNPNQITPDGIDHEENAELRRVMLERLGHDQYILQSGLKPVHTDEYGELFRKPLPGDEDLVMVRVTNSTPEQDGVFKKYLLRVPPAVRTAHEAVAWTAGMDPAEYVLQKET